MVVSAAFAMILALSGELVPPDGCRVVAVWEDGSAVAECAAGHIWFVFEPDITRDGLWSMVRQEPPSLGELREHSRETFEQPDENLVLSATSQRLQQPSPGDRVWGSLFTRPTPHPR